MLPRAYVGTNQLSRPFALLGAEEINWARVVHSQVLNHDLYLSFCYRSGHLFLAPLIISQGLALIIPQYVLLLGSPALLIARGLARVHERRRYGLTQGGRHESAER
jgi:hypothetical protein